jgi:hypothetical protein
MLTISNTSTVGFLEGQFDVDYLDINSDFIKMYVISEEGISMNGDIFSGTSFSTITNISSSISATSNIGVYSGGEVTFDGTNLTNVSISGGSGYLNSDLSAIKFVEWEATTITLNSQSNMYIYVDNTGTIISNQSTLPTSNISYIILGRVYTTSIVVYYQDLRVNINQQSTQANFINEQIFGNLFQNGGIPSLNATVQIDVTSGLYYYGINSYPLLGGSPITFTGLFDNGSQIESPTDTVNISVYDGGAGTLIPIPGTDYARHALYVIGGDHEKYLFVYATATDSVEDDAEIAPIPTFFGNNIAIIASIVVRGGTPNIISVNDIRNTATQQSTSSSTPTDHQLLTNRTDNNAHSQYYLKGGDIMSAPIDMGIHGITNATTWTDQSGVPITVSTISSRLIPGGLDALATGVPISVNAANNIGSAASFSRSDHVHAHGSHSIATDHAPVTISSNGFMLATDKVILNTVTAVPTASAICAYDITGDLNAENFITGAEGLIKLANSSSSFFTTLGSTINIVEDINFILPSSTGANGEFMQTDGNGNMSWGLPTTSDTNAFQISTTTGTNVNNAVATEIQWNSTPTFTSSAFTVQPGLSAVQINTAGRYKLYINIPTSVNIKGIVVLYRFTVNGNNIPGSTYSSWTDIKTATKTSANLGILAQLGNGDTVSVTSQIAGAAGTATIISNEAIFSIIEQ